MLNAEDALCQYKQGTLPTNWRVWRGQKFPILALPIQWFFLVCIYIFFINLYSSVFTRMQESPLFNIVALRMFAHPELLLTQPALWYVWLPVILAFFSVLLFGLEWYKSSSTLLLLLPEGVIEWTWVSRPAWRTYRYLEFSDIEGMMFRKEQVTLFTILRFPYVLSIRWKSQPEGIWRLNRYFEHPDQLAREIVSAHSHFREQTGEGLQSSEKREASRFSQ